MKFEKPHESSIIYNAKAKENKTEPPVWKETLSSLVHVWKPDNADWILEDDDEIADETPTYNKLISQVFNQSKLVNDKGFVKDHDSESFGMIKLSNVTEQKIVWNTEKYVHLQKSKNLVTEFTMANRNSLSKASVQKFNKGVGKYKNHFKSVIYKQPLKIINQLDSYRILQELWREDN
jgi:hypothetical protein